MSRYSIEREDHPEGNRWAVVDSEDGGAIAAPTGQPLRNLPRDDAEETLDALNYLAENEPALTPNVQPEAD